MVVAAVDPREVVVAEGSPVVGNEVTAVVGNSTVVPPVSGTVDSNLTVLL